MVEKRLVRNSRVEFLKIIGIFLIVVSHIVQTLHTPNDNFSEQGYLVQLGCVTENLTQFLLTILRYCGSFGNDLFFICSAFFLLESEKCSKRKIWQILLDVWVISILIFSCFFIFSDVSLPKEVIIKQFLPTLYANNWYVTCYLLFYPMHPFLNLIIKNITQKQLLRITFSMVILYLGINFVLHRFFFTSTLIEWVVIYFCVAYCKLYLKNFSQNVGLNVKIFLLCLFSSIALVLMTNVIGLNTSLFSNEYTLFRWNYIINPFIIVMTICLLNIATSKVSFSRTVNNISGLTLFIYIIHENYLLREYVRPRLWQFVYEAYGYQHIILWVLILSLVVFVFALICSMFYHHTIQKVVKIIGNKIYIFLSIIWNRIEENLLALS